MSTAASLVALAATNVREVAADSSLLLLVGGLSMLCLIVVLVILQNLFPDRDTDRSQEGRTGRGLRPFGAAAPAATAARRPSGRPRRKPSVPPVDRAIERVLELHLGEPRLLRSLDRFVRVRLYECRGCAPSAAAGVAREARTGCQFERGGLEEAFQAVYKRRVTVRETVCRCVGGGPCDFEVKL